MSLNLADSALQARLSAVWERETGYSLTGWRSGPLAGTWTADGPGQISFLPQGFAFGKFYNEDGERWMTDSEAAGIRALHRELREARGEAGA